MYRSYGKLLLSLALSAMLGAGSAMAQPPRDQGKMSREQAAKQAESRFGGRVLDVRPLPQNAPGYRVKLLDRGEVRVIDVPDDKPRNPSRARPDR